MGKSDQASATCTSRTPGSTTTPNLPPADERRTSSSNGFLLIGSADRVVRHESNSSKPYSRPPGSIQGFGKIGWPSGRSIRTSDTARGR